MIVDLVLPCSPITSGFVQLGGPFQLGLSSWLRSDVMVYWTTQSITSSCRLYYASRLRGEGHGMGPHCMGAPCRICRFSNCFIKLLKSDPRLLICMASIDFCGGQFSHGLSDSDCLI